MNGPEHYAEAERLIAAGQAVVDKASPSVIRSALQVRDARIAAAQVHATLALAAATLETTTSPTTGGWSEAVLGR